MEAINDRYRLTLLYDFYGELLNSHQKDVFSAAIFDDMSYSELSEEFDISRQAAFDLVKRIERKLEGYESRLGLLTRFIGARDKVYSLKENITTLRKEIEESDNLSDNTNDIDKINNRINTIEKISEDIADMF